MPVDDQALPVDAGLYADVAEHGALAEALAAVAGHTGVHIPEIVAGGALRNVAATFRAERGRIAVVLGVDRRVFSVHVSVEGRDWATGGADSLADVVGVVAAWQNGVTLRELCAEFPFMTVEPLALGYEAGDPRGAYWDGQLADPELTGVRPLLRAARQHPRLSELIPRVSHLSLVRFAVDGPDHQAGEVRIQLMTDGSYRVDSSWADIPSTTESIDEAIALAVALIPDNPSSREIN